MGINEFFRDHLGQKLKINTSWGAVLPNGVVALTVWEQELRGNRVMVHQVTPIRTKNGNVNQNWTERKQHFNLVKSGVPAVGVLISNGDKSDDEAWHIHDFNEDSIFPLSELTYDDGAKVWFMKIDLTNPIPVERHGFDAEQTLAQIKEMYRKAFKTISKAKDQFGWQLIGLTETHASLTNGHKDKLMSVALQTGDYKVTKA